MTTLRDRLEHWHTVTSETNTPPEPLFDIAEDAVERIRELERERDRHRKAIRLGPCECYDRESYEGRECPGPPGKNCWKRKALEGE